MRRMTNKRSSIFEVPFIDLEGKESVHDSRLRMQIEFANNLETLVLKEFKNKRTQLYFSYLHIF
jgi:hypothetical protein